MAAPVGSKRLVNQLQEIAGERFVQFKAYPQFPEKTDLWVSAIANTSACAVNVKFDLLLVADT